MSTSPRVSVPQVPAAPGPEEVHGALTARSLLVPLALAQFICSFAGSNMNVAISSISQALGTTVQGVQTAITLFLLTMAALMIVGSKLTDKFGRKRCFIAGLVVYGVGTVLAAIAQGLGLLIVGMAFIVIGILQTGTNNLLLVIFLAGGALVLAAFFLHARATERRGREPLLSLGLFANRTSNLALVTQNIQWLILLGSSFVVSVFLQTVRGFNAIQTGVIFTAATAGILLSSVAAGRLARRHPQRTLIRAGFVIAIAGIGLLLALYKAAQTDWVLAPGLFVMGVGVGVMLTPSVNVVQSAFPEEKQGEISGLSRSVSNLGSSLGTAIAGTILVSDLASGNHAYVLAMIVLAGLGGVGLGAAMLLPPQAAVPS